MCLVHCKVNSSWSACVSDHGFKMSGSCLGDGFTIWITYAAVIMFLFMTMFCFGAVVALNSGLFEWK